MSLQVSSPAFANGAAIPRKYTCDGKNVSPPLEWKGVPAGAKSIAIICDDPDAPSGIFTHWVLYDLPPTEVSLAENESTGKVGVNSFGRAKYDGPCPPKRDPAHRYRFHVYALSVDLLGRPGLSRDATLKAMAGCILAEGQLVGTYKRAS
jgi:Raf kinase inhibitor-like YbhB/YbcL family protein